MFFEDIKLLLTYIVVRWVPCLFELFEMCVNKTPFEQRGDVLSLVVTRCFRSFSLPRHGHDWG